MLFTFVRTSSEDGALPFPLSPLYYPDPGIDGVEDNLLEAVTALWVLPDHINLVKCLGCCVEKGMLTVLFALITMMVMMMMII